MYVLSSSSIIYIVAVIDEKNLAVVVALHRVAALEGVASTANIATFTNLVLACVFVSLYERKFGKIIKHTVIVRVGDTVNIVEGAAGKLERVELDRV